MQKLETVQQITETLSLSSERSNVVIANAIKAQLQVLTVVEHPELYESAFDLLLEHLDISIHSATDTQVKEIQRNGATMINTMLFFLRAKLEYDKDEHSKNGQKLLANACDMIADSTNSLISASAGDMSVLVSGVDILNNLTSKDENGNSFFFKIINWVGESKSLDKRGRNLDILINSVIGKLNRHRDLFGKSRVLGEFILNNKDVVIKFNNPTPDKDDYFKKVKFFIYLSCVAVGCMILVWLISLFFRGGAAVINATNLTEVGGVTSWYQNTGIWLKNTLLGSIAITSLWGVIWYVTYRVKLFVRNKQIPNLENYYNDLAHSFF
jgi:hypothetical protein